MLFPPPDFSTHLNYVSYMNTLSKNVNLSCNLSIKNRIKESKILKKKINLLKLTLNSIKGEYQTIQKNPDYAEVCVSWISVKSYYLIFNLMLILNYLIAGQEISFDSTHKELIRKFKECIKREEFSFNKRIFNTSFKCSKIMNFKIKQGANIKILNIDSAERLIQILKKIVKYKFEDFQRKEKIKNFRSKKNKQKKKEFLKNNTVNIWEFFYWYRIKAN